MYLCFCLAPYCIPMKPSVVFYLAALSIIFPASVFAQGEVTNRGRIFYEHQLLRPEHKELVERMVPGEGYGRGMANIGDLDGDGIPEIAVGNPHASQSSLYVLFLERDGTLRSFSRISSLPEEGGLRLTPGGNFGIRVENIGDWDKDGIPDVAVGEPRGKLGVLMYGKVWILLLNQDGSLKDQIVLSGRSKGLLQKLGRDQLFGMDISMPGDLNGDEVNDLVIGAPELEAKGTGSVWILLMNSATEVKEAIQFRPSLNKGDRFGMAVESVEDLNEDGVGDLAVGAPGDDETGQNEGAIYVLFMNEKGEVAQQQKLVSNQNGFTGYIETEDRFGSSLALIGDLNGDEIADLIVGSAMDDDGGKDKGALYALYLKRDGTVLDNHKISETSRNFEGQFRLKYGWGSSMNPLGDWNEDGSPDLLVNGNKEGKHGAFWMLFPADWPTRLARGGTWASGAGTFSKEDSTMLYKDAQNAADSARIDSMYDLSSYAPNNLVMVLDISASMNKPGKLPMLRDAFVNLLAFMRPEDKISVITYSGKAVLQLDGVPASEQEKISSTITGLKSLGETKPAKAIQMAYEQAQAHLIKGGNNRIIFATDGGFDFSKLDKPLEKNGSKAIPLSVFYFGKQPEWKLIEMQKIARRGFGNAAHITTNTVTSALLREVKTIRLKGKE